MPSTSLEAKLLSPLGDQGTTKSVLVSRPLSVLKLGLGLTPIRSTTVLDPSGLFLLAVRLLDIDFGSLFSRLDRLSRSASLDSNTKR